jgi:signal transduction histidine kinase
MRLLIDDLLTLARQGDTINEYSLVNLQHLAETCWRNVDTKDATLENTTTQVVHADDRRLQQLTENILRNAIDHAGPNITITIGALDDGFYIEDDGTGIDPAIREDLFDPGVTTSADGSGFGLAIIRDIVAAHVWEITTTDGTDGGARFEVTGVSFAEPME